MTPEELREALKPHGAGKILAALSGYSACYISQISHGTKPGLEHVLRDLQACLPEAQRILQQNGARTCDGKPCKHCGGTLRYISNSSCVPCAKKRANSRGAA